MNSLKNIELFIKCRKLLFPNCLWRIIYYLNPGFLARKKTRYINQLKDELRINTQYYEEALYLLLDLLKTENRIMEMIDYYNSSIYKFKYQRDFSKVFTLYKLLINFIKNVNPNHITEMDKITLLAKYYDELSSVLIDNYEYSEAIYYLEQAHQLYRENDCYSAIENLSIKIATVYVIMKDYDMSVKCLDKIIKYKPRYSFNKRDIRIILLYFLSLLVDYTGNNEIRAQLETVKRYYKNIYECEEYLFIINMISCVENADINHFTHEVHRCSFQDDPIYKQIFIDIHKNIIKNSRKISYSCEAQPPNQIDAKIHS